MKFYYILLVPAFILGSCSGEAEGESSTENEGVDTEISETDEEDALAEEVAGELDGLTMNAGEKWKVDSTTAQGMIELQAQIDSYDGEDPEQLGKDLHGTLKAIIKDCSMKGEDHNQYHIVLKAMKKEAKQLKKGKSTDPSKMQRYIDAYNAHFELG